MRLVEQLTAYVHAAFAGIWVQTQEPDEAEREILQHARRRPWRFARWDVAQSLRVAGLLAGAAKASCATPRTTDPPPREEAQFPHGPWLTSHSNRLCQ